MDPLVPPASAPANSGYSFPDYVGAIGHVTQDYNSMADAQMGLTKGPHHAYDIAPVQKGKNPTIPAFQGGTVLEAGSGGPFGDHVVIQGDDGNKYTYGHLMERNVKPGDKVTAKQQIGLMGDTGNSTANHLHFQVNDAKGNALDPASLYAQASPTPMPAPTPVAPSGAAPIAPSPEAGSVPSKMPPFVMSPGTDTNFRTALNTVRTQLDSKGNQKVPDDALLNHFTSSLEGQFPGLSAGTLNFMRSQKWAPGEAATKMLNIWGYGDPIGNMGSQKALQQKTALATALNPSMIVNIPNQPDPNSPPPPQTQTGSVLGGFGSDISQPGIKGVGEGIAKTLGNIPSDIIQTGKDMGSAALQHLQGQGAFGMNMNDPAAMQQAIQTGNMSGMAENPTPLPQAISNAGQMIQQKFGTPDAAKQTLLDAAHGAIERPVSTAMSVLGAKDMVTGAAAPDYKQQELDAQRTSAVTQGKAVPASATDATVPTKSAKPNMLETQARKMVSEYIKPGAKELKIGKDPEGAILRNGISGTNAESFHANLSKAVDGFGASIEPTVAEAAKTTPVIQDFTPDIVTPIDEAIKKALGSGKGKIVNKPLYNALQELKTNYTSEFAPGEDGTLQPVGTKDLKGNQLDNLNIKRAVGKDMVWTGDKSIDEPLNQVKWKILDNLRNRLNKSVPQVANLNNDYSDLEAAQRAMERRMPVMKRNALGLGRTVRAIGLGVGTTLTTGNPVLGLGAAAGELGIEGIGHSALGKIGGANALYNLSQGGDQVGSLANQAVLQTRANKKK